MLIWSGFGILVPLFCLVDIFIGAFLASSLKFFFEGKPASLGWIPFCIVVFLSAVGIWYIAKYLDGKEGKVLIDPKTNQKVELKQKHTFFFIPMKAWAIIITVFDVIFLSLAIFFAFNKV